MTPELEDYLRQLHAITADARSLVDGLSEGEFNWRPAPDRWSIAECLVHLNLSVGETLPAFDRAIEDAQRRRLFAPGPFRYGWFARRMVGSMEPPVKRRFRTARKLVPAAGQSLERVLAEFVAARDELAQRIRRSEGLDLQRAKVQSPVIRFLRMPLGAYFAMILAHDRRHLWQARQVLERIRAEDG